MSADPPISPGLSPAPAGSPLSTGPHPEDPRLRAPISSPDALMSRIFFGADGLRAGWSLSIYLLLLSILIVPTVPLFRHQLAHQPAHGHFERTISATLAQDGVLFGVLLLSSLVMSKLERRPFASYGIGAPPHALRQLLTGIGWGLALLSLLVLILRSTHLLVFDGRLLFGLAIPAYAAQWALGFLSVGLFEEYFLRGFLLFTFARGLSGIYGLLFETPYRDALGFWTAAAILASIFGLSHGANPGESPIGLFMAAAAALVFSYSLWRTRSLWWAVGFHAAWDWAQSFLYGVADSGIMMQHHLFATHPAGRPVLSGGLTGPEGSLFVLPVLALVVGVIDTTLPPRPPAAHTLVHVPADETLFR